MAHTFAQLSDPHLSSLEHVRLRDLRFKQAQGYVSWRRRRRFEHRREVLDALREDLADETFDQLLVTGDLTHIGLPEEFRQAADWLAQLGSAQDVVLIPGNHDTCVATPWEDTFALWQPYMASDTAAPEGWGQFPTLRVRDGIAFIGVNTSVPKPPAMASGTAGEAQLARLAPLLADTGKRGLFRVVYLHHCPIPGHESRRKHLTDAAEVRALLESSGTELVLHGHGHKRYRDTLHTSDGDAPLVGIPSASAMGLGGRQPAEYNRYSVERTEAGWQLEIATRRYDVAGKRFVAGDRESVSLARRFSP